MHTIKIYKIERKLFSFHPGDLNVLSVLRVTIGVLLRGILVIAFIITGLTVITSNTDLLFGIRSYTVLTGSMEPTIPTGSIIYSLKNLGYNIGDVITYKASAGRLITHRVVSVESNGEALYVTKGDANTTPDTAFVTADKIVGKTLFSLPFIGWISELLKTPTGFIAVVFIPSVIIILFELWNIKKEIEKGVERRLLRQLEAQRGAQTHAPWPSIIS